MLLACSESPTGINEIGPTWLEVYNGSDASVSFEGWTLTLEEGDAWTFGPGSVGPFGAGLITTTDDPDADWVTSLAVPAEGGVLQVHDARGHLRQSIHIPALQNEHSFGRVPDGAPNWQVIDMPSPGIPNDEG